MGAGIKLIPGRKLDPLLDSRMLKVLIAKTRLDEALNCNSKNLNSVATIKADAYVSGGSDGVDYTGVGAIITTIKKGIITAAS